MSFLEFPTGLNFTSFDDNCLGNIDKSKHDALNFMKGSFERRIKGSIAGNILDAITRLKHLINKKVRIYINIIEV